MNEKIKTAISLIFTIALLIGAVWFKMDQVNEKANKNVADNLNKQAAERYSKMLKDSGADKDPAKILTFKMPTWNSQQRIIPIDVITNEDLASIVEDINKTLPTVFDENVRLDSLQSGNQTLQYNATLLKEKDVQKAIDLMPKLRLGLVNLLCADEFSSRILNAGIKVIYNYKNTDNFSIGVITLSKKDCDGTET